MTKKIIAVVGFGSEWIGGVYYVRNILTTLLADSYVKQCEVIILCPKEHIDIFSRLELCKNVSIIQRKSPFRILNLIGKKVSSFFGYDFQFDLVFLRIKFPSAVFYPINGLPIWGLSYQQIMWIPDFQHRDHPEFFSNSQVRSIDAIYSRVSQFPLRLVLSSQDALQAFRRHYPNSKCECYCVPFVSDAAEEFLAVSNDDDFEHLSKFNLLRDGEIARYVYIPNQFWKHKNHKIAFRVFLDFCAEFPQEKVFLVCSGNTKDHRNPSYFEDLIHWFSENAHKDRIKILGFINRVEQISILKNCRAVLQPSLYEGWGTGVQEAKLIGKQLILSDIPIHREQSGDDAYFFSPETGDGLFELMRSVFFGEHKVNDIKNCVAEQEHLKKVYSTGARDLIVGRNGEDR